MAWQAEYQKKLMTADAAVRAVKSDMRVYVHANSAFPLALLEALARRSGQVRNVEVMHLVGFGEAYYNRPEFAESFRHNALFVGVNMRQTVGDGRADYIPIHLSEVEALFVDRRVEVDVALLQVSPPDRHGYCSLGVAVETTLSAARCARVRIAQVNDRMPRTFGNTFMHVSEFDAIVEASHPLPEIIPEQATEEQRLIARNVATLIEDGACIQAGIGALPNAILPYLADRKNLGVHTETLSEGAIPLIDKGVITGARKQINPNKIVLGFVLGTREWYEYVDDNPIFDFQPSSYCNDPFIISQNDNVVAINSAIEVDITGQVVSDSVGGRFVSGFGGQLDFMRGAARSRGGKPIIAIASTAKNGTISRIVPQIQNGAGVVTTRADVHYVVTEYGVADLHGKNVRQRAEALIQIAHPRFREELNERLRANGWGPKVFAEMAR
ncbi:MAG TPA: acetyl-CoA hydrolase/transferase C-terminal domain-containing protein [Candidatus Saccharimonadales bacterium]|nr:acetyl-CoA hydrolase/transferase C-terminal domain-containing protein [Candidatus Saccharimonadales bacterium]